MYTPPPDGASEPEHIARYLTEPIGAAWRAFDKGRVTADEFFVDESHPFDAHLWAHLARYEAVQSLKAEPTEKGFDTRYFHHSGIEFSQPPFTVKVCKAVGDGPQSPGRNAARKTFFQQFKMTLFDHGDHAANLIIYWRVIGGELDLGLCKPKGLWKFKHPEKLEWRCPVQYDPLAGLTFPTAEDDEIDVALRFDADEEFGSDEDAGE